MLSKNDDSVVIRSAGFIERLARTTVLEVDHIGVWLGSEADENDFVQHHQA